MLDIVSDTYTRINNGHVSVWALFKEKLKRNVYLIMIKFYQKTDSYPNSIRS